MKRALFRHSRVFLFSTAFVSALAVMICSCRAAEPALAVKIKGEINQHPVFSVFVLPEEEIDIAALQTAAD